jgi:hypothetical protein
VQGGLWMCWKGALGCKADGSHAAPHLLRVTLLVCVTECISDRKISWACAWVNPTCRLPVVLLLCRRLSTPKALCGVLRLRSCPQVILSEVPCLTRL